MPNEPLRVRQNMTKTEFMVKPRRKLYLPVPLWLYRMHGLNPSAKLLYGRLCLYSNDKGEAWPSQATLADEMGVSVRAIAKQISQLEDAGLLESRQRPFGQTTVYTFPYHEAMDSDEFDRCDDRHLPKADDGPDDWGAKD